MKLTKLGLMTALLALVLWTTDASAHDVRPGESVRGEVAGAGAVATLDIDLAAGDSIKLVIKARGVGGVAPALALLDPDGETVASADNERKMKLAYEARETGTHQIRLTTDAATSSRFTLKVRGDATRCYSSRDRTLEFGAVTGSRIDVKVKSKGDTTLAMYDGAGDDVTPDLSGNGRKVKARIDSCDKTDDYALLIGPAGARTKVHVTSPAPRGQLLLTMSPAAGGNGSYTAPAAQGDDEDEAEDEADDAQDPVADGNADNGAAANDGTVGGPGNDGTVPAAGPQTDHSSLTELLAARSDAELSRIRIEMARHADRPVIEAADALAASLDDAIATDIHDALAPLYGTGAQANEAGIRAMIDLVAAQRRADRARRAFDLLAQEIPNSTLAADGAFAAGQAILAAEMASLDAAIAHALAGGLRMDVAGEDDPEAGNLDAPAAPAPTNEMIAGLAALDAAVMSGPMMTRARASDAAAIEAAEALYATYEDLLSRNEAADANAPTTLSAIRQARNELATLRTRVFGVDFEIALLDEPRPAADEAYSLHVQAFGANGSPVEFDVEGAEDATVEAQANDVLIHMAGHAEAKDVVVRARFAGVERVLSIHIEPGQDDAPEQADVEGRIVDASALPVLGATWEIRDLDGRLLENDEGQPMAGATAADGRIEAARVPAGEWVLVIVAPGVDEFEMPLSVEAQDDETPQHIGDIVAD